MRGKQAKRLRRQASSMSDTDIKYTRDGRTLLLGVCVRKLYKDLKKEYLQTIRN